MGLLLVISLLFTAQSASATKATGVPLGLPDFGQSEANLRVESSAPDFTVITIDQPTVAVAEQMVDFQTYHSFTVPGES